MEITLKYSSDGPNGDYEITKAKTAINAEVYKDAFEEVWDRCFRPNNKHGYPGGNEHILNKESSYEVIEALIKIYQQINTDMQNSLSD